MIFEGALTLCDLVNTADKGLKPKYVLKKVDEMYFGDRVIGYNRQYAAMGASQVIDKLIRVWRHPVRIGQYTVIDGDQYRVDFVQDLLDEDQLPVTDITLRRMEKFYDVAEET